MLARAGNAITYNEHLAHDGPGVFEHACRLGLEGIVSIVTVEPVAVLRET
jgi:ATP-dependent DNA ligase